MARWHRGSAVAALCLLIGVCGHSSAQQAVPIKSPDGGRIASAVGKVVHVTDALTGKLVLKVAAHKANVTALGFAPDGKLFGSADKDGTVCMFDAATGKMVWTSKANPGVNVLEFSKDGKKVTAIAPGGSRSFALSTGKEIK